MKDKPKLKHVRTEEFEDGRRTSRRNSKVKINNIIYKYFLD